MKIGDIMFCRFISLIDSLFSAFISFVVCFLILNFYIDKKFAIIFSVIIAILIFIIAISRISDSNNKKILNKNLKKDIENTTYYLSLLEKSSLLSLFHRAITKLGKTCIRKKQGIFIDSENIAVFPIFSFDKITKTDIVRVFNSIGKNQSVYILGNYVDSEILAFINRFDNRIIFIGAEKVYLFLQKLDMLPKEKLPFSLKKLKFKDFLSQFLKRENAKKYLFFGLIFISMSYFAPIKLYYIIIGCIFLILSLFLRLFGAKKNKGLTF